MPYPGWVLQYEHLCDFQHFTLNYFYEEEEIALPLSYRSFGDRGAIRGDIAGRITLQAELASYGLRGIYDDGFIAGMTFLPQGGFVTQNYQVGVNLNRWGTFSFYHRQDYLNSQGYFYQNDQLFGIMTRGDLFISLFDITWENPKRNARNLKFLYRNMIVRGYLRGHIEFWPFTSFFIDLLGLRRYYRGEIQADVQGLQGMMRGIPIGPFKIDAGLSLWYIEPSGWFSHWQPVFLVFGKMDEQTTVLDISKAWIGGVTLAISYKNPSWELFLSARQFFPIHIKREPIPEIEPLPPEEEKKGGYGGGFFNLSLRYFFL